MDYVSVGYYPLSGDKANYVGMAEAYADYLVKSGGMPEKGETPQLFLEFLGGALCRQNFLGFPYQSVQASTTFTQVREILQDIGDSTGASPVVKLTGFGNAGLDAGKIAGGYTFHNRMGGERDTKPCWSIAAPTSFPCSRILTSSISASPAAASAPISIPRRRSAAL